MEYFETIPKEMFNKLEKINNLLQQLIPIEKELNKLGIELVVVDKIDLKLPENLNNAETIG
jgi:hypothetical protein